MLFDVSPFTTTGVYVRVYKKVCCSLYLNEQEEKNMDQATTVTTSHKDLLPNSEKDTYCEITQIRFAHSRS